MIGSKFVFYFYFREMNWIELIDFVQFVVVIGFIMDWIIVVGSNSLMIFGGQVLIILVNILGIDYYNGFGFIFDLVRCFIIFGNDVVVLMVEDLNVWEVFFNILVLVYIILFFIIGFFGNFVVLYVYIEKWGRSFI